MNKIIITGILIAGSILRGCGQDIQTLQHTAVISEADSLLNETVHLNHFAGVSAGIFKEHDIIWEQGAGYLNIEKNEKATHNMLHRIASITKPMTAVAIMQLVEAGSITLDTPIREYLPQFPEKQKGKITVRQLLNHTSGIKGYKSDTERFPKTHYTTLEEAMAVFKHRPLNHKPGTAYGYSTYGYVVLGAILERQTGIPYDKYMKKNVWEKAGMAHTDIEEYGKKYPNKAALYTKNSKGEFVYDIASDLSVKYPGGGLHATVGDLLRFGQAILDHNLIASSTLNLMMQTSNVKRTGTPYGLGWFVVEDPVYGKILRHNGSQSGTSSYLTIYLDRRVVIAVIANTARANEEVVSLTKKLSELTLKQAE